MGMNLREFLRHRQFSNTWIAIDVDKGHDGCFFRGEKPVKGRVQEKSRKQDNEGYRDCEADMCDLLLGGEILCNIVICMVESYNRSMKGSISF